MLDVIASYHCMQFQGKLMNQTWENGKIPSFGTDFGPFRLHLGPKTFFHGFYLYYILGIVANYYCLQCLGKSMNQIWENAKKPSLGPILAPLVHIWAFKSFVIDFTSTTC